MGLLRQLEVLEKRRQAVTVAARRQVQEEEVQLSPGSIGQKLPQHRGLHRSAPDGDVGGLAARVVPRHRCGLVEQEKVHGDDAPAGCTHGGRDAVREDFELQDLLSERETDVLLDDGLWLCVLCLPSDDFPN